MRTFKRILIGALITLVLWTIGCSTGLPVIPFVETDYFIDESSKPLAVGFIIANTDREVTKIEIPNYYPDNEQCLDFWFTSSSGKHVLTVRNFTMTIKDKREREIDRLNSYLFSDNGSEDEKFSIKNYELEKTGGRDQDKYVFFRSVFDLSKEGSFSINIKADYLVDGVQRHIDKTFELKKSKKLTWNEFRVH